MPYVDCVPAPTVYARVTTELKEALDSFAESKGMTQASAVTDLLIRGLEAASNETSIQALERRIDELEAELTQVRQAAGMVEARLRQVIGRCKCGNSLTGRDFMVTGSCSSCGQGVSGLLIGTGDRSGSVNRSELMPFLAGVGAAAGLLTLLVAVSQ